MIAVAIVTLCSLRVVAAEAPATQGSASPGHQVDSALRLAGEAVGEALTAAVANASKTEAAANDIRLSGGYVRALNEVPLMQYYPGASLAY